ncbi:MAG TPA: flagellar basal body P-ring formation chaperone FlgA [Phycisphaerae bacterium]|nr:flagellar basal body P-ring formation chaperone FlgA [Phycisphaerae bacterium]HNU46731.1 flagellar basal body P-ring formation chaperone FlgA [Phycisphaerae bacterium]
MTRKECDKLNPIRHAPAAGVAGRTRWSIGVALAVLGAGAAVLPADADGTPTPSGVVRLWSTAVVGSDDVRLDDVAELLGFSEATARELAATTIAAAPAPGGTRVLHLEMVRGALTAAGANLAAVTLRGSVTCSVSRPALAPATDATAGPASTTAPAHAAVAARAVPASAPAEAPLDRATLRRAVLGFLNGELARYDGRADVVFDRTDEQVLDLTGPPYKFAVRRQGGMTLGLVRLEVEVSSEGRRLQTVPLVVRVALAREVVVARVPINQGAIIRPQEVQLVSTLFTRLDQLGLSDPARVIGQRARRFLRAGSMLEPGDLDEVPLVTRNQLVTLTTTVGSISVTTAAKAMESGGLGDVVSVRSTDNRKLEYHAVVVGPGKVELGPEGTATASQRSRSASEAGAESADGWQRHASAGQESR